MRLKSYFSATVEAAMEMARKELGEDALLVNARPTSGTTRSLGALEVVFGLPANDRMPTALLKARLASVENPAIVRKNLAQAEVPNKNLPRAEMAMAAAASHGAFVATQTTEKQTHTYQTSEAAEHQTSTPPLRGAAAIAPLLARLAAEREKEREKQAEEARSAKASKSIAVAPITESVSMAHDPALARDIAHLRSGVERLLQSLPASAQSFPPAEIVETVQVFTPQRHQSPLYRRLIESEITADIALQIAACQGDQETEGAIERETEHALLDFIRVAATLGCSNPAQDDATLPAVEPAIVALVGSPGAGKTTTLIKLAARYGLAARRPAHIISIDVNRVAAADQLRVLAAILGIGCTVVETVSALAQIIEEHRNKDFVFIDTPGFAPAEMNDAVELAAFLGGHPRIDTHMVLPASMRAVDMARMTDLYRIFAPAKLLFTKVDETERYGALISESARSRLPISFLSMGQTIPEDLEPASQQILAALVLGQPLLGQSRNLPHLVAGKIPEQRRRELADGQTTLEKLALERNPRERTPYQYGENKTLKMRAAGAGA